MREIDFLPEWYSQGKQSQYRGRRQYMTLAVIFLMMVLWNAMAQRLINKAQAQLDLYQPQQVQTKGVAKQFRKLQMYCQQQREWLEHIKRLDTKFDVSPVLAELSYCVHPDVKVTHLEIMAQPLDNEKKAQYPYDPIIYECVIEGMSNNPISSGMVLDAMEESKIFSRVQLNWSKQDGTEKQFFFQLCADIDNGLKRRLPSK